MLTPLRLRYASILALAATLIAVAAVPTRAGASRTPAANNTLTAAFDADFTSMDPAQGYDPFSWTGEHAVFNGLLGYAHAGGKAGTRIVPDIAASLPSITNGGKVYTFTLRHDVRFSPPVNREVTAADFKYSIERALAKSTVGAMYQSPFFSPLSGTSAFWSGKAKHISGIRVLSRYRIQFRLNTPDIAFSNILALPFAAVVPKETVAKYGNKGFSNHVVGTGPYMMQSWQHGRQMVLVKNPNYFRSGLPHVPKVVISFNVADHLQILRAEKNQLDLPGNLVTSTDYLALRTSSYQKQLVSQPDIGVWYLAMNMKMKPFKGNLTLRRGLNMAINKAHIIRLINNRGFPMNGIFPPTMPGAIPNFHYYKYNPTLAAKNIRHAGYPAGKLHLTMLYISGGDADRVADSIQQDLAKVGVKLTLKGVSANTAYNIVYTPGKTQFTLFHWGQDYPDPSDFVDPILTCRASSNAAQYCDPKVDHLAALARADTNQQHRYATYRAIERRVMSQAPWVPLYGDVLYEFHSARVKGFYYHPVWPFEYAQYSL
jgi:oligopeptide transport system substrate-binding protein